jgi:hypothetical protein
MNNVHMIGAPRKTGRRRERPLPDVPLADVISILDGLRPETPEERLEAYEAEVLAIARHLLGAIQSVQRLNKRGFNP